MAIVFSAKRMVVLAIAIALIVLSAIALSRGNQSTIATVIQIVILVCSIIGAFGALSSHLRWLQVFLFLEIVLFIWQLVLIIVWAVNGNGVSGYDIALAIVLFIGAILTADIIQGEAVLVSAPGYAAQSRPVVMV